MSVQKIHVVRGAIEIGQLTVADARELLHGGFLRRSDVFWTDEDSVRRPLSDLPTPVASVFTALGRTAGVTARSVRRGVAATVQGVSRVAGRGRQELAIGTVLLLEDSIPMLRKLVGSSLATARRATGAVLEDEEFLQKVFGAVYDVLPRPVRRFVTEKEFVEYCLHHRSRLTQDPP